MSITNICPLQAYRHLTLKFFIQGHPWRAKVPHAADFKSTSRIDPYKCSGGDAFFKRGATITDKKINSRVQ